MLPALAAGMPREQSFATSLASVVITNASDTFYCFLSALAFMHGAGLWMAMIPDETMTPTRMNGAGFSVCR
jgi:hypothetical protein